MSGLQGQTLRKRGVQSLNIEDQNSSFERISRLICHRQAVGFPWKDIPHRGEHIRRWRLNDTPHLNRIGGVMEDPPRQAPPPLPFQECPFRPKVGQRSVHELAANADLQGRRTHVRERISLRRILPTALR
jgi:hypothetical protein